MFAQSVEKDNCNGDQGPADDWSYEQDGVCGHPASFRVLQGLSSCWPSTLALMLAQRKIPRARALPIFLLIKPQH
jgi:hypothetical protein